VGSGACPYFHVVQCRKDSVAIERAALLNERHIGLHPCRPSSGRLWSVNRQVRRRLIALGQIVALGYEPVELAQLDGPTARECRYR